MRLLNLLLLTGLLSVHLPIYSAGPEVMLNSQSWDYSPSWMVDTVTGKERLWWCSDRFGSGIPNAEGDVIKYSERMFGNANWSSSRVVMTPNMSGWEGVCTCDPAVVRGNFSFGGQIYTHAMYYTSSATCSTDNKIGVAFSNDGINWIKRGNPIISSQFTSNPTTRYGAGQAQLRNTNGQAAVTIWHTDTPTINSARIYERTSTNGINFSAPKPLSNLAVGSSTPIYMAAAGISLSPYAPHYLYMIVREGTKILQLYKIPFEQRFTGKWTKLGKIMPGSAGGNMAAIFEPGFRTDIYGNLWSFEFPTVWVGMGCGPKYLDDPGVDPTLWQLCQGFPE